VPILSRKKSSPNGICHHPAKKVITQRKKSSPSEKSHHPAKKVITRRKKSSPGEKSHHPAKKVITRLVRVIQRHKPESKGLEEGVITRLPEQVGQ
jgi:hypothetical protein